MAAPRGAMPVGLARCCSNLQKAGNLLLRLPDLLGDTIAILLPLLRHAATTLLALGHRLQHANLKIESTH